MTKRVPLLLVFVTQLASVVGDATGQRCSRVYHKRNRPRFLISMVLVTSLQMFMVMLFVQLAMPSTADQLHKKVNGTVIDVCELPKGDPNRPDEACYPQGPLTMYKAIGACPVLLCNGLMNILYYFGEATMYRESLGVMLLVMCALVSTFLVSPIQEMLGMGGSTPPGAAAVVFGVLGALLCTAERSAAKPQADGGSIDSSTADELLDDPAVPRVATGTDGDAPVTPPEAVNGDGCDGVQRTGEDTDNAALTSAGTEDRSFSMSFAAKACELVKRFFPLIVPFAALSFTYALYFCMMQLYDEKCDANPWGYNSIDQVGLPVYLYPTIFLSTTVSHWWSNRQKAKVQASGGVADDESVVVANESAEDEPFWQAVKHSLRENAEGYGQGFAFMFLYRLFINGRAISYFFIAVEYDLSEAYFVLTLVRVLLSWVISLIVVLVTPRYIGSEPAERAQLLDPVNITAKCVGSVCVVFSLLFTNGTL